MFNTGPSKSHLNEKDELIEIPLNSKVSTPWYSHFCCGACEDSDDEEPEQYITVNYKQLYGTKQT